MSGELQQYLYHRSLSKIVDPTSLPASNGMTSVYQAKEGISSSQSSLARESKQS